jgi:hypothetical protein
MRKFVFAMCFVFVLVSLGVVVNMARTESSCQVPSSSTYLCYDPDDRVLSCNDVPESECNSNGPRMYEIMDNFPDGTVPASEGATKEESVDCWRRQGCTWSTYGNLCQPTEQWSAWRARAKIVENTSVTCPQE